MLLNCSVGDFESPLDCKEIQPVYPKGNESWIFFVRTDVEAETPILWPPDAKSWLIGKDPDAGKDWKWEKGTTEDRWLDGITNVMDMGLSRLQALVIDRAVWRTVCCPCGHKESDTTEWLNWTEQYSCLENPIDTGAWRATVHGMQESDMTEQLNKNKNV